MSELDPALNGDSVPGVERWRNSESIARAVFVVVTIAASIWYLIVGRRLWFENDEWAFLTARSAGSLRDLLTSHQGHWSTLPILVYRLMWQIFGLRTYFPYQFLTVVLHAISAVLVLRVMRRAGVQVWVATTLALVLVLFGYGRQNILWGFQITQVGSLVLGLTHLLLSDHDGPMDRRDALGLAAGFCGMLCSGVAVTMVAVVGAATFMRRGWRVAVVHTVPLGLVYVAWWALSSDTAFERSDVPFVERGGFVVSTLLNSLGAMASFDRLKWLLLALLIIGLGLAWRKPHGRQWSQRYATSAALLGGAVLFLVITSFGRAGFRESTYRSRYLDIVLAMLLPAIGVAADAVIRRWRLLTLPVFVLMIVGIPRNILVVQEYTERQSAQVTEFRNTVLALPRSELSRRLAPNEVPLPRIRIGALVSGVEEGRVPAPVPLNAAQESLVGLLLTLHRSGAAKPSAVECVPVLEPLSVTLEEGQEMYVAEGSVRIVPPAGPFVDLYRVNIKEGWVVESRYGDARFRVIAGQAGARSSVCVSAGSPAGS